MVDKTEVVIYDENRLNKENVRECFDSAQADKDSSMIVVYGVLGKYKFSKQALELLENRVSVMLSQTLLSEQKLPVIDFVGVNSRMDSERKWWTISMDSMDQLLVMGTALDQISWVIDAPVTFWKKHPHQFDIQKVYVKSKIGGMKEASGE